MNNDKELFLSVPIVEGSTKVTITGSAAGQVVTEPPVFRLQGGKEASTPG